MTATLPYALGCPSCRFFVEVSEVDADASLSGLLEHILVKHAGYDRKVAYPLLAKAQELTETEAAKR